MVVDAGIASTLNRICHGNGWAHSIPYIVAGSTLVPATKLLFSLVLLIRLHRIVQLCRGREFATSLRTTFDDNDSYIIFHNTGGSESETHCATNHIADCTRTPVEWFSFLVEFF